MMKTVPFVEVTAAEWDDVVERSQEAWLFHRTDWIDVEARFFAEGCHAFGVRADNGELAGVCPAYVRQLGREDSVERVLDTGQHRHAGPAVDTALPVETQQAARAALIQGLRDLAASLDVDRIQLNAHNLAPAFRTSDRREPAWFHVPGFQEGLNFGPCGVVALPGRSTPNLDQVVALDRSEATLFDALEPSCRRAVRKALASGVHLADTAGEDPIDAYLRLARQSATRTGEQLPPADYFADVWSRFGGAGRCVILFAEAGGVRAGALLMLVDKGAATFFGGVSDPEYLPLRVNDFLHWEAIKWGREQGLSAYRLGPIFPTVPDDWPISRVSRFKRKFGGGSLPILQGSIFLKPERYVPRGATPTSTPQDEAEGAQRAAHDLAVVLRPYGYLGVDVSTAVRRDDHLVSVALRSTDTSRRAVRCVFADAVSLARGVPGQKVVPPATALYARRRGFLPRRRLLVRPLVPHVAFTDTGIDPVWVNEHGDPVIARQLRERDCDLLIGLPVVEELVRRTQGDPAKVESGASREGFGFAGERPNYLFEDQVERSQPTTPWADIVGYTLAKFLAAESGAPLVHPLPSGASGLVLLTGDDDQAELERYAEQLGIVNGFPITYYLHPLTRHTAETVSALPPNVEFGIHVDALETPDDYEACCENQSRQLRALCGRPARTVRNHGYLNRGYLGHLPAWDATGLRLDLNYPGVHGTALNGSFLPHRCRRADLTWSSHFSLLTPFGDGMLYALKMTEQDARRAIRRVADQVERADPGVLTFNFHPQNIRDTSGLHAEVLGIARRAGWSAMTAEQYLDWIDSLEELSLVAADSGWVIESPRPIDRLVVHAPTAGGFTTVALPAFRGAARLGATVEDVR